LRPINLDVAGKGPGAVVDRCTENQTRIAPNTSRREQPG